MVKLVRWWDWLLLGAFGLAVQGCYTLQPVSGVEPQVGTVVAFDVNDAGRTALGGTIGPEIAQVEGRLLEKENGRFLLAVSTVRLLRGGEQVWSGEQVRFQSEYLGPAYERRFSAGRTALLGAAGVGGLGAFFLTRSLLGAGTDDGGQQCPEPPCDGVDTRIGRLGRP